MATSLETRQPRDTLIRGGLIVDGSGAPGFEGDLLLRDGRIAEVAAAGSLSPAPGADEVDAEGLLVTPGFVDVHTHYDGQATWDSEIAPSCYHGVTSVVMGNCGVGFAPIRPGREQFLIELMEGVEDIPGTALAAGMDWRWESFPEYLEALAQRRFTLDVGTQVPHAAVRAYVMDERSIEGAPTSEDLAAMTREVRMGLEAGALGVSTSRILSHRAKGGEEVPGTFADEAELMALAAPLRDLGTGVFEVVPRGMDGEASAEAHAEIEWMGRIARAIGRPLTFSMVQTHTELDRYAELLERCSALRRDGVGIHPQVANRSTGILIGLQTDEHTFSTRPSYRAIAHLPLSERVAQMRKPEVRKRILSEDPGEWAHPLSAMTHLGFANQVPIGAEFDVEPPAEGTIAALAEREGRSPEEVVYDHFLEAGGRSFVLFPFTNYFRYSLDDVHAMLTHETSVWGLGDGGAHCGVACDAGGPTLMLAHWVRDRTRGPRVPLEQAVKWLTSEPAELYGLGDRGRIARGLRADVNLIDRGRIGLELPEMIFDLPASGRRLMQRARGYVGTWVHGVRTIESDELTGALPGRLIRGPR